jgi:hypothetical protein
MMSLLRARNTTSVCKTKKIKPDPSRNSSRCLLNLQTRRNCYLRVMALPLMAKLSVHHGEGSTD